MLEIKNLHAKVENKSILNGINLNIKPGEIHAIMGKNGSGKSTLLDVLMLLLEPTTGSIFINGEKVNFTDKAGIRSKWMNSIGHVPQEIFLIDDTVKNNIMFDFGSSELSDDDAEHRVETAARFARVHDVIMHLPFKYESVVGERGTFLSGGQKQRLAIARALYRNSKVILLDEPTNALDIKTEELVLNKINNISKDITIIMISHSDNSLKFFDRIFDLDKIS